MSNYRYPISFFTNINDGNAGVGISTLERIINVFSDLKEGDKVYIPELGSYASSVDELKKLVEEYCNRLDQISGNFCKTHNPRK
jgi:hypothetical protein